MILDPNLNRHFRIEIIEVAL